MEYSFNVLFPSFPLSRRLGKYVKSILSKFSQCILYLGKKVACRIWTAVLVRESTDHSSFMDPREYGNGAIVTLKIDSFSLIISVFYRGSI